MQLHNIKTWLLSSRDYKSGIELYKQSGGGDFYINLFEKFENPFTRGKLAELLEEFTKTATAQEEVKEVIDKPKNKTVQPSYTLFDSSVPEVIKNYQREKGILFKEVLMLRKEIKQTLDLKTKGLITVKEALQLMEQENKFGRPVPFSVTYVTWNEREQKGGQIISWRKAVLASLNLSGSKLITGRKPRRVSKIAKNPHHWKMGTRNIHPEGSLEYRKLHIWLMFEFNGMEVIMSEAG